MSDRVDLAEFPGFIHINQGERPRFLKRMADEYGQLADWLERNQEPTTQIGTA